MVRISTPYVAQALVPAASTFVSTFVLGYNTRLGCGLW
jgi:hypothetical protein